MAYEKTLNDGWNEISRPPSLEGCGRAIRPLQGRSAASIVRPMSVDQGGARRPVAGVVLSWAAMLGVDLLLHAGVLAPLYDWSSPFLLAPEDAFVRIPIGYASFLLQAMALAWLLPRLSVQHGRDGALVGGAFGAVVWGALVLGLWSISTAEPGLLAAWWIGQSLQLAVGGAVIGSIQAGSRLRAVAWRVGALVVVAAIVVVALQSIGYAEAPVLIRQ